MYFAFVLLCFMAVSYGFVYLVEYIMEKLKIKDKD